MEAIKINKENIILDLTKGELGVIINALNEVCNGIEVWEFDTRMGITIEDARILLESLGALYRNIPAKEIDHEDE